MSKTFQITPKAEAELKAIGRYTLKKWGIQQRNTYLIDFDKRFKWLSKNPHSGKHRPDIEDGYYCYLQGSHLIFYLIHDRGIYVIGLPHKAMDIVNYFDK